MADVLDVDVEDKGGFSEDEGDGKNFTPSIALYVHDFTPKFSMICVALQREFKG